METGRAADALLVDGNPILPLSTAGVPPRERGATLHSLRESGILPIEPLPDLQPHVAIEKRSPWRRHNAGSFRWLRQGGHAGDDVFFGVNLTGESTARQGGRELNLRSGDALFFVGAESDICFTRPTPVRFVGVRVRRSDGAACR